MINKHKSNKIKENSNTMRHLNNGTDHRHSKSCCDQSSPARRTRTECPVYFTSILYKQVFPLVAKQHDKSNYKPLWLDEYWINELVSEQMPMNVTYLCLHIVRLFCGHACQICLTRQWINWFNLSTPLSSQWPTVDNNSANTKRNKHVIII